MDFAHIPQFSKRLALCLALNVMGQASVEKEGIPSSKYAVLDA